MSWVPTQLGCFVHGVALSFKARESSSSTVGVWGFLPTTYSCLSPNPLLDRVTCLAFSAWNLPLLTAVAILGELGTALNTGGSQPLPLSVLLLTSRQSHSDSLETWTQVLEVIWRPQLHICHHSVLQGHHGSRRRRWRGGLRGQFLGGW